MGRAPRELTPQESALHFFGAELRHWRTVRKLSQAKLGRLTHDSGALISKIEKGERFPSLAFAQRMDEALATGGALEQLWPQVEHERTIRTAPASTPLDSGEPIPVDLGLVWSATTAATVEVVGKPWRADVQRRSVLLTAAWVASAFAGPIHEWLLDRQDEVLQDRPGRHVGQSDIDALWVMCEAFTDADLRLGGGYARSTLMHYVNQVALPLLHGSYSEAIGRELMAATARLCNLCAYTSYDSGRQGLAQRYYIQALRLAQASGNRSLGAHILADMSTQAHYLGNVAQALELATAGYRTALDRVAPTDDRTWFISFTADQLLAQRLYMAADLGCTKDVQRIAPETLTFSGGSARRHVLYTTTFAASYLPPEGNSHCDPDRACELLGQVLPSLGSVHSALSLERFNGVRRKLAAYANRPSVQEFEDRFRSTVMAVGTPA
ncbi:MAG: helix-turn-helix domain-containing protein [Pseudonocardiaceae bacterium]